MKKFFTCLLLFFITHLASANTESSTSTLKLKFYKGLPFVDLKIQNHTFPMLIDLGASHIAFFLKQDQLQDLHFTKVPITKKLFNACKHQINETAFILNELQIGHANFKMLRVIAQRKIFGAQTPLISAWTLA